jgi:uncharacterized membrane protein YtjA (UPF0391 family)
MSHKRATGARRKLNRRLFSVNSRWHAFCFAQCQRVARRGATEDSIMLYWAAVFFIIALLAAVFGFGGIAASAAGVAKILFLVFLVLAVVSLIFGRRVST